MRRVGASRVRRSRAGKEARPCGRQRAETEAPAPQCSAVHRGSLLQHVSAQRGTSRGVSGCHMKFGEDALFDRSTDDEDRFQTATCLLQCSRHLPAQLLLSLFCPA